MGVDSSTLIDGTPDIGVNLIELGALNVLCWDKPLLLDRLSPEELRGMYPIRLLFDWLLIEFTRVDKAIELAVGVESGDEAGEETTVLRNPTR